MKKTLIVLLLGTASFICSCVDGNYDLANKKVTTDVKLEGNKVALPVGGLKPIVLDSLIDVNEIEMLEKNANGVYSITMDSTISIEENVEQITLNIEPVKYNIPVDFKKASIKNVHIDTVKVASTISSPEISLDSLNHELPTLHSEVRDKAFDIPGLGAALETLAQNGGTLTLPIATPDTVSTGWQEVPCEFSYTLPSEIKTIRKIALGSEDDANGTLVNVIVTNPTPLAECNKRLNFRIDFPENFKVAKNEDADQAGNYTVEDGHSIVLEGFEPKGETSVLSFYLTEITNVDEDINAEGVLKINQPIKYIIDYIVSGDVNLSAGMVESAFSFDVDLDVKLAFLDVEGSTKDIDVEFQKIAMNFKGEFDDLEYIDTINYIVFNEEQSRINFTTTMDKEWLEAFQLQDGYALKISFPQQLDINNDASTYKSKGVNVVYDADLHTFYVKDMSVLVDSEWELVLQKLVLNKPVDNGKYSLDFDAEIGLVKLDEQGEYEETSSFVLAGQDIESLVDVLDKLNKEKSVVFAMEAASLDIDEAVVHTEAIKSELAQGTDFNINEEIPAEIKRIERIGFNENVPMTMVMNVIGVDSLNTEIDLKGTVTLPSFLELTPATGGISVVDDGVLEFDVEYNPSLGKPLEFGLLCSGMDFTKMYGADGLQPEDSYIKYDGMIDVNGQAVINSTKVSSSILDREISFDVEFVVDTISVKTFHGIYATEIEGVDEEIDFDLGEELEFLREDGNSITLADPQLEFVLTNPVGIPVGVDLHIYGYDEAGVLIEESKIDTTLNILPAEYDKATGKFTPVETKLFLTTDTAKNKKVGYENVEIKNLANLLKKIPHTINLGVEPVIKTEGVTHHVDIAQPIKLDASYSVVVPLRFNDLHLCYSDTITGLDSDLGETMSLFNNVSLSAKMDIINTIPLSLVLNVTPLDIDGNVIEDIEIDSLAVYAGSGEALVDADGVLCEELTPQNLSFAIKSKSNNISALDGLAFSLEAASDHITGPAALKGEQGIKLSNIVIEISGDIEGDLMDLGNKE